jgi:hypothetical protein
MLRRIVPASAAILLLLSGLTACSAESEQASECVPVLKPGALSDAVKVNTGFGEVPDVKIPKDLEIETSQRSFAEKAEDRTSLAGENTLVSVNLMLFDAATGSPLEASPAFSGEDGGPEFLLVSKEKELSNPVSEAVRCAAVGDRVVLAVSPKDAADSGGASPAPLVAVIDVVAEGPLRAQGAERSLPNGFPAVVTNDEGRPGVVLPPAKAPEGTRSATRIEGDGAVVNASQNVVAHVLDVQWDPSIASNEQKIVANTWSTGLNALGSEEQVAQSGLTYRSELTGKTVGSQVVIIENVDGNPRVVVVDILGVS